MGRKLEIGGGSEDMCHQEYEQLDLRDEPWVDHVADARKLPFEDNTFDEVYASQVLEHFGWRETWGVVTEWYRVVKPGGYLIIQIPIFDGIYEDYKSGKNTWNEFVERMYGSQDYEGNVHYTIFSYNQFKHDLENQQYTLFRCYKYAEDGGMRVEILKSDVHR